MQIDYKKNIQALKNADIKSNKLHRFPKYLNMNKIQLDRKDLF